MGPDGALAVVTQCSLLSLRGQALFRPVSITPLHRRSVEVEEVGDALGVIRELPSVGLVHERVKALVGLQEIGRHGLGIVEDRQRTSRIGIKITPAHVENRLRGCGDRQMGLLGRLGRLGQSGVACPRSPIRPTRPSPSDASVR